MPDTEIPDSPNKAQVDQPDVEHPSKQPVSRAEPWTTGSLEVKSFTGYSTTFKSWRNKNKSEDQPIHKLEDSDKESEVDNGPDTEQDADIDLGSESAKE